MSQKKNHYTGLSDAQVLESRAKHGVNILTPPEKDTLWDTFKKACTHKLAISMFALCAASLVAAALLVGTMGTAIWVMPAIVAVATVLVLVVGLFGAFYDPLFQILIVAFILSMGISVYEFEWAGHPASCFFEPIGIIVALLLATGVAFFLERANEKTFQSLNEVNDDTLVKVIRNNNICQVPRRDVVVGDITILEAGEEIPADCQLLESLNLSVNESTLTGELSAAKTTVKADFDPEATYPSNEIMKGTTIIEGYCTARVIRVGDATESGKVFESAQMKDDEETPLTQKFDKLAQLITKASYIIGGLIIVGRIIVIFVRGEADLTTTAGIIEFVTYVLQTIMIAVTLIVVSVPEGLPMSITLSLAFSMRKLMKENTLPRTMHACETMGAASVICTDKTGTLTQNQMRVSETSLKLDNNNLLAELIAANSTANLDFSDANKVKAIGNPTEGALLLWLHDQGRNYLNIREEVGIIDRLPFTTENKYMATIVQSVAFGCKMLFVKGAPEILMDFCKLTDDEKTPYNTQLLSYQSKAYRTLALAYMKLDDHQDPFADGRLTMTDLEFAGVFGISDPVRAEVPAAINDCTKAGIQVKIVTGDTPGTAKEIGRQVGIWSETDTERNIITGVEFAALSDEQLLDRILDIKIMSRARPADKERLVRLLKSKNMVVAVTGDGTNDAPALNAANVGLSMGDGTAVAKEASDMTILDNSFSTISNAVMWGRSLYKNIQRFIMFQMTINVVACLIVLIGAFVGTESPLTVTQMLWVNLIMDTFAAIALSSLPPTKQVMADKPRRVEDNIISRPMATHIFGVGIFFTTLLLGILLYFQHNAITSLTTLPATYGAYDGLSEYELSLFFTIFVMLQFWNMFNAKAFMTGRSALARISECKGFITIAAVILVGQILIVECGGQMFNVTSLNPTDWAIIIGCTAPVCIVGEVYRLFQK